MVTSDYLFMIRWIQVQVRCAKLIIMSVSASDLNRLAAGKRHQTSFLWEKRK